MPSGLFISGRIKPSGCLSLFAELQRGLENQASLTRF